MKSRPILFSGTMVRAILEDRKTQTRWIVKRQRGRCQPWISMDPDSDTDPNCLMQGVCPPKGPWPMENTEDGMCPVECPYGQVGDRLWVRETWAWALASDGTQAICYQADMAALSALAWDNGEGDWSHVGDPVELHCKPSHWKPSIFLPKWANRITLEITGIRVEQLQDISEENAIREGVVSIPDSDGPNKFTVRNDGWSMSAPTAKGAFALLWDDIYGDGSWDANPWVWTINFRRVK